VGINCDEKWHCNSKRCQEVSKRVFSQNLRSQLRMVFVDHRGSGPSPGPVPVSEFSLDQISDDLELVRNELGLGEV